MESEILSNVLKQQLEYYKEENAKMESILQKCNLINEESELSRDVEEIVKNLANYQEEFNTKDLNANALVLAYVDRLQKRTFYTEKLKTNLKTYTNLNSQLTQKIEKEQSELEQETLKLENLCNLTPEDFKVMEEKIKNHEKELLKYEKKHPWLKDEKYDLINISKQVDVLTNLKAEEAKLNTELNAYHGLKPDLKEAKEQLAQIKVEYEQISNKLLQESN